MVRCRWLRPESSTFNLSHDKGSLQYGFVGNKPVDRIDILGHLEHCWYDVDFRELENNENILKVEGLAAYQQAQQTSPETRGVTTARLGVEVTCKEKRFCGAKIKYGAIIRMAKVAEQQLANQIYWSETDHWIDQDKWYINVGIPESEKLEAQLLGKEYFSDDICEQLSRSAFEALLVRTFAVASDASYVNWDESGKHLIGGPDLVENTKPIIPRAIPLPRCK
jgi:hypothetical protein